MVQVKPRKRFWTMLAAVYLVVPAVFGAAGLWLLGELPGALRQMGGVLHQAREEVEQALRDGAAKVEGQKLRLEAVISDLDMGVAVCDGSRRRLAGGEHRRQGVESGG